MWQIIGYWLGWSGSPGKGRAVGVGEVKFKGVVRPDIKRVRYEVSMRQVRRGKLAVAIANGRVLADDTCVYLANDMRVGLIGASGIVGGGLPAAVGSAYASQVLQTNAVSVASFGDGATNIGTFHESVNLAAVWRLPVVFVCENNLYGEFTPVGDTCLVEDLAERAAAYGISGHVVDGNDVEAVRTVAAEAIARARAGEGPSLIEAKTYRHRGHSRNDPARYRPDGELEAWKARDPIEILGGRLAADGILSAEDQARIKQELQAEVDAAADRAAAAPYPTLEETRSYVYAD
jgi:pyruvate dehydrogenase E1 component alpha subunit